MKKLIAIGIVTFLLSGCWNTAEGEKTGVIVKLAKQGAIWGTYEGELIRGGMTNGSGAWGKPFDFTVSDSNTAYQLTQAMEQNKQVRIKYHEEAFCWLSSESNCVYLDSYSVA